MTWVDMISVAKVIQYTNVSQNYRVLTSNKDFFAHLDKATIKPFCCEVSHPKLLSTRRYG